MSRTLTTSAALADAERAYRDQAARDYEGGAFYGRRDIETLAEMAALIARFSRESAELAERLNCGQPEGRPDYPLAHVIAEAMDGFVSRAAWAVLAASLDLQTEPEAA